MLAGLLTSLVRPEFSVFGDRGGKGEVMFEINCLGRRAAQILGATSALIAVNPVYAGTANGNAASEISDSLRIVRVDDLDFGRILPSAASGRVVINQANGNCTAQAGATLVGTGCHRAQFVVSGAASQSVTVALDAAPITLIRNGGGASMIMDRLSMNGGPNKQINASGQLTFYAGGRLQVGANQAPGFYEATFNVTVDYR
jgi:uncharacterized protein DUF4402